MFKTAWKNKAKAEATSTKKRKGVAEAEIAGVEVAAAEVHGVPVEVAEVDDVEVEDHEAVQELLELEVAEAQRWVADVTNSFVRPQAKSMAAPPDLIMAHCDRVESTGMGA